MKHLLGGILVGSLLLLSCGGDDDSSDAGGNDATSDPQRKAYVDAMAASITDDTDGPQLDETSTSCLAAAIVDTVGADRLDEAGVTPEQLTDANSFADLDVELPDDAASNLAGDIADCGIAQKMVDVIVDQFGAEMGGELPDDAAACLADAIDEQTASQALATTFVEGTGDSLQSLTLDAVGECPEVMTAMMIAQAPGPVSSEDAACMRSVIEDNADVVRSALLEQDAEAADQLGVLMVTSCPGLAGTFAGG